MKFLSFIFSFFIISRFVGAAFEDARCKCVCLIRSENGSKPMRKNYVEAISTEKCTCDYMLKSEKSMCPYCDCKFQVRNTTTIKVIVCLILTIISALTLYMIFFLLLEPLYAISFLSSSSSSSSQVVNRTDAIAANNNVGTSSNLPRMLGTFSKMGHQSYLDAENVGEHDVRSPLNELSMQHKRIMHAHLRPDGEKSPLGSNGNTSFNSIVLEPNSVLSGGTTGVTNVVNRVRDQQQRWKGNVQVQRSRVFSEHSLLN